MDQDPRIARLLGEAAGAVYPRPYLGVRLKLAKEFADYDGDDRKFRDLAKQAGVAMPGENIQKFYTPAEIRRIRQFIMSRQSENAGMAVKLALMIFRITKGGVGKTTTSANVASCLAHFGFRVLVIDADSQGSISTTLGYNISTPDLVHVGTLLERISRGVPSGIRDAVVPIYEGGMLDLIPADITLANEAWMYSASARESLFSRLMKKEAEFFNEYDAVIVDCAPGTSLLATSMMAASDIVTAVVTPEPQALLGLFGLESNLREINEVLRDPSSPVSMHIVTNRFSQSYGAHMKALQWLIDEFGPYVNDTVVRSYAGFMREVNMEDVTKSAPLLEREPTSSAARNIMDLTRSLIHLYNVRMRVPAFPVPVAAAESEVVA